ncbi:pilus assembly protein [Sphingomonas ginkgonis]|uniref:Pilus assembly protein n=2 Tax=Sphingomonas ginkgonis TaxID=2315330 RepID=A0A429VE92_9SPHN|nr:pilus assembly protein [Sphingomonas ginkgonis]
MTEFALALPLLCLLCLAGLEIANLSIAYLTVNSIAIKTADNAARVRTSIDETDINDIFFGAKLMGQKIDFARNGRIILSSIEPVMSSGSTPTVVNQYIRWQRCTGANAANSTHGAEGDGASGTAQASGYGLSGGPKITAARNTAVMLAEVVYAYQPLFSNRWFGPITIRTSQTVTVRERSDQAMKNEASLSNNQRMLCSNPHAA